MCGITAQPPHREIQKTALGATESVNWKFFSSTLEAINALKEKNFEIAAIEQAEGSTMLNEFQPSKDKIALIFGNEVKGVEQDAVNESDVIIEIPQHGTKHSLNISVSVGIVVWDIFQKVN